MLSRDKLIKKIKMIKKKNNNANYCCNECGKMLVNHELQFFNGNLGGTGLILICYICRVKKETKGYACSHCGILTKYPDNKSFYEQYKFYETKVLGKEKIMDIDEFLRTRSLHKDYCSKFSIYMIQYKYIINERKKTFVVLKDMLCKDILRYLIQTYI